MNVPRFNAEQALGTSLRRYMMSRDNTVNALSVIEPQLPVGGGSSSGNCTDRYQDCYIDCSVRYPESNDSTSNFNAAYRQACYDSCDAAYRLCSPAGVSASIGWSVGQLTKAGPRIAS
jgi:hypothetical protein